MKMDKKKIGIVIVVVAIIGIYLFTGFQTRKGVAFIKAEENKNLEPIETQIDKIKEMEMQEAIESGKYSIYSMLGNFVFYGDSRVLHYATYGFVDQARIFADNGYTYAEVPEFDDALLQIHPKNIFIAYGINDIYYGVGNDLEGGYPQLVENSLRHIVELMPDANIYVCGMIPISPGGLEYLKMSENSADYNNILKDACNKIGGINYIDDEVLSVGGLEDIYVADGYHFKPEFYPVWTQYLVDHMK